MTNTTIRPMEISDIDFAQEMTSGEGWNNPPEDLKRLLALNPDGCFMACRGIDPIGMIFSIVYDDFAFLGDLIIKPGFRGRGIGTILLKHLISHLQNKGIRAIELDGVFEALPLYRRLGFKDKYLSLRLKRLPDPVNADNAIIGQSCKLTEILNFDKECTGLMRSTLIRRMFEDYPGCIVNKNDENRIDCYGIVKPRTNDTSAIGPLVSLSPDAAATVLDTIIAHNNHKVLLAGIPEINPTTIDMFLSRGFVHIQPSLRMYLGQKRNYEEYVYAITSADMG